jgi:hypothetical protein
LNSAAVMLLGGVRTAERWEGNKTESVIGNQ